jgi:membrane protein YdbS with pleckstrin-like domain
MLVLVSALIVLVVLVSVGSLAWAVVTALVFGWLLGHSINIVVRPDRQRRTVQPDRLVRQWLR